MITLPESVGNLKSLQILNLDENQLITLPESIGNLKSLQELYLENNQLTFLPESIGNLQSIQVLDMQINQLNTLPESIGNLISLQILYLGRNRLVSLPESMWLLKNLKSIRLGDNSWKEEWREIAERDAPAILEFSRQRASINIFLSHAVVEYETFRIKEIAEYLYKQDEIYKIFYCEEDLAGNIDDFMNVKLPQCQLVLFFASKKSVSNSKDCKHELAKKHNIQIIPIKGSDVEWKELEERDLSRELGYEFDQGDFGTFCQNLYDYIKKFKREIDLFESEQAKFDRDWLNFKTSFINYIDTEDFKENFKKNWNQFAELFQDLSNDRITFDEYFSKITKLIEKKK